MAKLLYTPVGIAAGLIAGFIGTRLFELVWKKVSDEPPPEPDDRRGTWPQVLGAAAIKGAIFGGTRALVQRSGAKGFERATGAWPGDEGRG